MFESRRVDVSKVFTIDCYSEILKDFEKYEKLAGKLCWQTIKISDNLFIRKNDVIQSLPQLRGFEFSALGQSRGVRRKGRGGW